MVAAREELFGREMREESEDCPGQECGDFLDVFSHRVVKKNYNRANVIIIMPLLFYSFLFFMELSQRR